MRTGCVGFNHFQLTQNVREAGALFRPIFGHDPAQFHFGLLRHDHSDQMVAAVHGTSMARQVRLSSGSVKPNGLLSVHRATVTPVAPATVAGMGKRAQIP